MVRGLKCRGRLLHTSERAGKTTENAFQKSHLQLLVGQVVKGAKGHADGNNLCSLALVKSSLFLCATFMPVIDF